MSEDESAGRLRAVAQACRDLGMRVTVLRVGDITVQLGEPWGQPIAPRAASTMPGEVSAEDEHMEKLRKLSVACFGTVLPDEQLRKMGPAMLRGS